MGSFPWLTLRQASRAAILLLLLALQQNQTHDQSFQLPQFLLVLGDGSENSTPDEAGIADSESEDRSSLKLYDSFRDNEDAEQREEAGAGAVEQVDVSPETVSLPGELDAPVPPETGMPTIEIEDPSGLTPIAEAAAEELNEDGLASMPSGEQTQIGDLTEDKEETIAPERSKQVDLQTVRQLVEAVEEAAEVAGGAVTAVEAILKDVLVHKQECEARSRAIGEKLRKPLEPKLYRVNTCIKCCPYPSWLSRRGQDAKQCDSCIALLRRFVLPTPRSGTWC